jgi:hypothetical protein
MVTFDERCGSFAELLAGSLWASATRGIPLLQIGGVARVRPPGWSG